MTFKSNFSFSNNVKNPDWASIKFLSVTWQHNTENLSSLTIGCVNQLQLQPTITTPFTASSDEAKHKTGNKEISGLNKKQFNRC